MTGRARPSYSSLVHGLLVRSIPSLQYSALRPHSGLQMLQVLPLRVFDRNVTFVRKRQFLSGNWVAQNWTGQILLRLSTIRANRRSVANSLLFQFSIARYLYVYRSLDTGGDRRA